MSSTIAQRSRARLRFEPLPGRVRYSWRWLGVGAGVSALATLALRAGGLPVAAAMGAAGLAGAAYALRVEPQRPQLSRINLSIAGLPAGLDGLRIGHLSDLHLGHGFSAANATWAVAQMQRERPDLIALTGDFVSYDHAIGELAPLLAPLSAPLGIYAVPGNHDHWEGLADIRAALEPLGVQFLINRGLPVRHGGATLYVAGVDDPWEGETDVAAALSQAPADTPVLLLAHAPDCADAAAARGVQVQLSGHTHGGHLRLPGLGAFCLPRHGWRYAAGKIVVGPTQLYVSRGLGGVPLRFGCRPEAAIVTLRAA